MSASAAFLRASSIDAWCESEPATVVRGYAWAMSTDVEPRPQPSSATRAPAVSLASTPSSAGIQLGTSSAT
jgi:hypothetical protein